MHFPENTNMSWLNVGNNQFTGPLPDIPAQVTSIGGVAFRGGKDFRIDNNRFSGSIPSSWWMAKLASIDLSNCGMVGELPDVPPSVKMLVLRGN